MGCLEKIKNTGSVVYCKLKDYWNSIFKHKESIMLAFTFITVLLAAYTIEEAKDSTKLAIESIKLSELNVNKTTQIAEWYYNPKPQINMWTSVDYELNESGVVYVDEWYDYINGNGFNISQSTFLSAFIGFGNNSGYYYAPGYLACCKSIKISVYNSGRGSIIFPIMSFDLEAKNKTDGILFKVHTIRTPIDKLEYDPIKKYMFESQDFIEKQQIWMPYGTKNDFPPYIDENGNSYFIPPRFSKELLPYNPSVSPWDERSDILGPFRIGTIPPGESVEIELKIFSAKGRYSSMKEWSSSKDKAPFPPSSDETCKEGSLNITVQSLNTNISSKIVTLKTGKRETCES